MAKYFMDSEFIDDGFSIDLISIGLVSEDGREYYAQSTEFKKARASKWVVENVLSNLTICTTQNDYPLSLPHFHESKNAHIFGLLREGKCGLHECPWRTREQIRDEVTAFCDPEQYGKPEFIGWCCSYDHVAICQLFGTMMDIPTGWPHYMRDLQHVLDDRSITDELLPEQDEQLHNALADAKHIKRIWQFLETWHSRGVEV